MTGYIYILKNPSFPNFVKIGYADDVEQRLKQLNSTECTPFAFRVYATYEVNSRLLDKRVHSIIDKLNPTLRSIDEFNGQKRVREFYAMSAEDAYSVFEAMAEIHGCMDKLKKWEISDEDLQAEEIAEEIEEESVQKKRGRLPNYTFEGWRIPPGAILQYVDDPSITCTVIDHRRVEYNGEAMYMTKLARVVSGNQSIVHGPGYIAKHFLYNGRLIQEIEDAYSLET